MDTDEANARSMEESGSDENVVMVGNDDAMPVMLAASETNSAADNGVATQSEDS